MKILKKICLFLICFVYSIHSYGKEFEISICAIFQNEDRFLKEWIDYHRKVGVEHFWLYNNNNTDNFYEVLLPYIEEGVVELTNWYFPCNNTDKCSKMQLAAYNHGLLKAKERSEWVAFIDTDEFIVPINKSLLEYLEEFKEYSGICLNWQMYGTGNVWDCEGSILSQLLYKADVNFPVHTHVKSIVQPSKVSYFKNPHHAEFSEGYQVTENKVPFHGPFSPTVSVDKLRLNHYWCRDEKFLHEVKIPRMMRWWGTADTLIENNKKHMEVYDDVMLKFLVSDLGYVPSE